MAHSIVMNWNFARGEPVIESTLDTHTETGDSVPRYRFTKGANGATMVYKIHNRHSSPIGHIRWNPAMHASSVFLRANSHYNGRGIGSGIPLHEFRRRVEGTPDAREFTLNGRSFFWIRSNEHLQDMICWCRTSDGSVQCAAFYEENGGILTIHAAGQSQDDVIDEIPVSCVINLYMRDLRNW
ncbi:hypothetical protein FRC14_005989 [Serendipita sp. 396]|nr:hypothetical protein FRC14_005989 [Serendipita sp. 396]KAG8787348.1 hypothetical protein FRC15_009454 [Serendipita sp. 397]KAG8822823.1 hypothetical protein FRC19_005158 [Serendipita sp. 401]KAG8861110.1 hypothetical protein FRB91_009910 [Serendipita sp. 411]KAG9056534.1 hypothetical protein FS842_010371 [Serendipita sp. 407]